MIIVLNDRGVCLLETTNARLIRWEYYNISREFFIIYARKTIEILIDNFPNYSIIKNATFFSCYWSIFVFHYKLQI